MLPSRVFTEMMGRLKGTKVAANVAAVPISYGTEGAGGGIGKTVADTVFVGDGAVDAANGVAVWNCAGTAAAAGDVVEDGSAADGAPSMM